MKLTPVQDKMVYWIRERWAIHERKVAGEPAPWTKDNILQSYRFCNVNREHDKVTSWIRTNWKIKPRQQGQYEFAMVVARLLNWIPSMELVGQPQGDLIEWLDWAKYELRIRQTHGEVIWGPAYIVSTNGRKMNKLDYIANEVLYPLAEKAMQGPLLTGKTLKEAHGQMVRYNGFASFLAAQIIADLKNTKNHPLAKAQDWWKFSSHGPGSLRGLSWFFNTEVKPSTYQDYINKQFTLIEDHLPDKILHVLCMQNLQNCNCEFDKYIRTLHGGRPKRKYKP